MIIIDCSDLTHARQLHERIAQVLSFPDWYGHNLDALYDCLTELSAQTTLCLLCCDPARFPGFAETFADAAAQNPNLTILLK